jgi:hypothetical protein
MRAAMIADQFIKAAGSIFDAKECLLELGLPPIDNIRNMDIGRKRAASPQFEEQIYGLKVLWCLASIGNRDAASLYSVEIERHVEETDMPEAQATHFLAVAANWRRIVDSMADIAALMSEPSSDDEQNTPGDNAQDFGRMNDSCPVNNGFVVLSSIGDPLSQEGRNLSSRFAPILKRAVPRRGLTPAEGAVSEAISMRYPWATGAADIIERSFSLIRETSSNRSYAKPMMFVGEKGTGKTSLAIFVAQLLGRHWVRLPAAGTSDSATLGATPRGWSNFRASMPTQAILESKSCDPCIIVDELDKASGIGSQNGSVIGILMGMLDLPASYYDTALMANIDLSHILFIATANRLDVIPEELRDRFTIIPVPRPTTKHFDQILETMRIRVAEKLGVDKFALPSLDDVEYTALKSFFANNRGALRPLSKAYEVALKSAFDRQNAMLRM